MEKEDNNAIKSRVRRLYLFDFDDTIAVTPTYVGIQRLRQTEDGLAADPNLMKYLDRNGIVYIDAYDPMGPRQVVWIDTAQFEKFRVLISKPEEKKRLNSMGIKDNFDWSPAKDIDIEKTVPIANIIKIIKAAASDPAGFMAVITARAGRGKPAVSLAGEEHSGVFKNEISIGEFLKKNNINIGTDRIYTTGNQGGRPADKVKVIESLIEEFSPEEIHFYDDSTKNVNAVYGLCQKEFPQIKIYSYTVKHGEIAGRLQCESFKRKFRTMRLAGIF